MYGFETDHIQRLIAERKTTNYEFGRE